MGKEYHNDQYERSTVEIQGKRYTLVTYVDQSGNNVTVLYHLNGRKVKADDQAKLLNYL